MTHGSVEGVDGAAADWRSVALWVLLAVTLFVQGVVLYAPQAPGESPFPSFDKVVHVVVFAVPAAVAVLAGMPWRWVLVVLGGHAVVSEVVQGAFLTDRSGDPRDAVADLVGIGLGVAGVTRWRRFRAARGG